MADESRFSLRGRVALVTGSTSGLGQAMAHVLGAAGASVALNYANHTSRAEQTFEQYRAAGHHGKLFRGNVIDPSGVRQLVGDSASFISGQNICVNGGLTVS